MLPRQKRLTFALHQGDHATYQLGADDWLRKEVKVGSLLAVDIETGSIGGPDEWTIKAVVVATEHHAWVLDPLVDREAIKNVLAESKALVFHNAPYDVPRLYAAGLMPLSSIERTYDTILLARLSNPNDRGGNSLGQVADRVLGLGYSNAKRRVEEELKIVIGAKRKGDVFDKLGLHSPAYVFYAGFDGIMTRRVFGPLIADVKRHHADHPYTIPQRPASDVMDREHKVMRVMLRRSSIGLKMADDQVIEDIRAGLMKAVAEEDAYLHSHGVPEGLSDTHTQQFVMTLLAPSLPATWPKLKNGMHSADKKWLTNLEHPLAKSWLRRSEAKNFETKFLSTYFRPRDGRVHPSVNVGAARTGRMSYGSPPLQQIPDLVRPVIAHDVPMTSFDWSSVEPVILFNVAQEAGLLAFFEAGGDIYQPIADAAGVPRKVAKMVLLANLYGQGIKSLAERLGISEDAARLIKKQVTDAMPKAAKVMRMLQDLGTAHGRVLTMYGRNVPIDPDPSAGNFRYRGYQGVNYYVQGSAYDLLATSIATLVDDGYGDAILMAIHDELVVETEAAEHVNKVMTTPPDYFIEAAGRVPMLKVGRTDLGLSWSSKQ